MALLQLIGIPPPSYSLTPPLAALDLPFLSAPPPPHCAQNTAWNAIMAILSRQAPPAAEVRAAQEGTARVDDDVRRGAGDGLQWRAA